MMNLFQLDPKRKRRMLIALGLLFLSLYIAFWVSYFFKPGKAIAAWFDDAWGFRQPISIPTHTASENNVYVTVPAFDATDTSRFQADCGDLRFTKQNGELLPYYVVDCDSTANIHVQFDTLPAGASTYYMYYGNPSAPNGTEAADFATAASGLGTQTAGSEEKSQGPVAYWKFDDGTGTTTKNSTSVSGIDGTLGTNASWKTEDQCISGKCLYIDDAGSSTWETVKVADNASLTGMSALTVGVWIKTVSNKATQQIIYKRNTTGTPAWWSYKIELNSLKPTFFVINSSATSVSSQADTAIELNKWYYIVGVYNGSQVQIYVDTKAADSTPASLTGTILDTDYRLQIGGLDTASSYYFKGFIDEVKIYPYARTAAQVKSDFKARGTSKGSSVSLGASSKNLDALSNGLVGYWKMDESSWTNDCTATSVTDSSGNANNGKACPATTGPTGGAVGKFGNGGSFDGSDDEINITDATTLQAGSTVTVSAWFKLNATASDKRFVDKTNNGTGYALTANSTTPIFITGNGSTYDNLDGTTTLTTGTWYHMVGTVDNGTKRIYINGNLENTASITFNGVGTGVNFRIGARAAVQAVNASIDEVRLYNRALSPAEVAQLYSWAPGPVGYWNFDEKTGTSANDTSGNGYTGTINGSASWKLGKYGSGLSANGSSTYVSKSSASNFDFDGKDFTVEAWIKPNAAVGDVEAGIVCLSSGSGGTTQWCLVTDNDDYVFWTDIDGSWAYTDAAATTDDVTTDWAHIVGVYTSGSSLKIYKNGVLIASDTSVSSNLYNPASPVIWIGRGPDHGYFNGVIDDVRIYNYARTSKQIVEDMNAGHPAPGSPVGSAVGNWKFDEGYGTTVYDSSPIANNGTFGASPRVPTWTTNGKFGKALNFDASTPANGDVVNLTDNPAYQVTTGLTLSAWVNPSTATGNSTEWIIARAIGVSPWDDYNLTRLSTGAFKFQVRLASGLISASTATSFLSTNTWYHLVGTYDATTGNAYIYVNGVRRGSGTGTGNIQVSSTRLKIGCWSTSADACDSTTPFNGLIDEVKIYNSALTADEVKLDYNHGAALVLGTLSDTSQLTGGSVASSSAQAAYCVPGDTTSCSAPVAEWKFEEKQGTTAYDTSGNGNDVNFTGNPTYANAGQCKLGSCLSFDGNGDYLNTGKNFSFTDTSISFWMYPNATTNDVITEGLQDAGIRYRIRFSSNKLRWEVYDGVWQVAESDSTLSTQRWYHVTATIDSGVTNGLKLYINGQLQTTTDTASMNSYGTFWVGTYIWPIGNYFNGRLDNLKVFNYARTAAQIAWDYNRGGPVGWWKFDECQGTVANDSSGKGNSGTITIGATVPQTAVGTCTTASTAWGNGVTGKFNSSLNFDGADDYVSAVDSPSLSPTSQITVSAWIKEDAIDANIRGILSKNPSGVLTNAPYELRIQSGAVLFQIVNSANTAAGVTLTTTLSSGTWYHIVGTFNGTTLRTYLNGLANGTPSSNSDIGDTTGALNIGQQKTGFSRWFNGQIDDVRVYNYALTATQIKQLYNGGAGVKFGPATGSP